MTLHQVLPFFQGCLSGVLLGLVLWKNPKSSTNQLFAMFLFSLTMWAFTIFGIRLSDDLDIAIWWERAAIVFIASTPVFFYLFAISYLGVRVRHIWTFLVYLYLVATIFLAPTGLIVDGMTKDPYGNAPIWGPLFIIYISPIYFLVFVTLYRIYKSRRIAPSYEERNRLLYFVLGGCFSLFGNLLDVLPALGIDIYPGGILGNSAFVLLTTLAIVRYHLFDIHLATYKIAPYLAMAALVTGPYLAMFYGFDHVWGTDRPIWAHLLIILAVTLLIQPLWRKVQYWTNRLFYLGRYEHVKALDRLQDESQSIIDPANIKTFFPTLIKHAMQSEHIYLLLPSSGSNDFQITSHIELAEMNSNLNLGRNSSLAQWLRSHDGILHNDDLDLILQLQSMPGRERGVIDELRGELYVPLKSGGRLVGLMVVGPKINRQPYSWEEERLIKKVAGQMALNIENVMLYQASLERERQLGALGNLNKAMSSSLDIQSTYDLFVSELRTVVPVDLASVILIAGDELHFLALYTSTDSMWGQPGMAMPIEGTFVERMMDDKEPISEADLASESLFVTGKGYLENGIKSVVYLPLFSKGEVIGAFVAGSVIPNSYTKRELAFLEQVASQLSLTMDNALLYAKERGGRVRLEILNEQREEFFRAIAHELKTPLTAIKSSGELLSEELEGKRQAPLRRLSDNIRRSADRLEIMLNDLLDMAKARAVPLEMNFQRVDVAAAIMDAVDLCSPPIRQKHQELIVEIAEGCPPIMADPKWFEYIVTNLVSNANKYTPAEGKIKIVSWIDDGQLKINVEDTGAGIPEEEQDLIFEPFYRGQFSGEKIKGIGVGLATVKQIIRLHGGKVQVSSIPGKGSIFTVSLPLP